MIDGREVTMAVLNLRGRPADAIAAAAAAAGFDSITLRMIEPKSGDHGYLVDDLVARRALAAQLADLGVGLLDVEVVRLRPQTAVADLLPALDAAADLGARHVLTVCEDPDESRFVATYLEFAAACRERGLQVALEFMRFSECHSLEQAVRLARRAREGGATNAAVLVDALHLQRSGGTAEQVSIYAERFPELFPYVQLCDAPLLPPHGGIAEIRDEAVTGRLLPGTGELALGSLLDALPSGIPVCIETPVRSLAGMSDLGKAVAAYDSVVQVLTRSTDATPLAG